ncbi:MAG: VCBS repeat-containing protein [Planctomycetota bacterium]
MALSLLSGAALLNSPRLPAQELPFAIEQSTIGEFPVGDSLIPPSLPGAVAALCDFDGDGDPDFVPSRRAEVWINNGPQASVSIIPIPPLLADTTSTLISTGDFDGDGIDDILRGGLEIVFGPGDRRRILGADSALQNRVVVDADRDGDLDIFVMREVLFDDVAIELFENDGSGIFTRSIAVPFPVRIFGSGNAPPSRLFEAIDLDQSGDIELLIRPEISFSIFSSSIFQRGPSGFWTETQTSLPPRASAGDFDGDGDGDVLAVDPADDSLLVLWENVGGTLSASLTSAPGFTDPIGFGIVGPALNVVDVDRDGNLDVVQSRSGAEVAYGDGTGGLLVAGPIANDSSSPRVLVADLDLDGMSDIVSPASRRTDVAFGQPSRGLLEPRSRGLHLRPGLRLMGDFDGDGRTDLTVLPVTGNTGASVTFALQLAGGTYAFVSPQTPFGAQLPPIGPVDDENAVADLDLDGRDELYFRGSSQDDTIFQARLVASPQGLTTKVTTISTYPQLRASMIARNLDGDPEDELVILYSDGVKQLYENDGSGGIALRPSAFSATSNLATTVPVGAHSTLTTIDFDGDGDIDVLECADRARASSPTTTLIALAHINDGTGTFTTSVPLTMNAVLTGSRVSRPAVIDVDLDSDNDLVFPGLNQLFRNDGGGTFTPISGQVTPQTNFPYLVGDVTGDGIADLGVVPGSNEQVVQIIAGRGDGTFDATPLEIPAFEEEDIEIGILGSATWMDVDDDGDLDTVTSSNVLIHTSFQLISRFRPRLGQPAHWLVAHKCSPGASSNQPTLVALLVSPRRSAMATVTPFGLLSLDAPLVVAASSSTPITTDSTQYAVTVPMRPSLVGAEIHSQALVGFGSGAGPADLFLTNSLVDTIGF